jgi:hypothetical protein
MFHLAGFTESQDSATLVNVAALADQSLQVQGDDLIVPDDLPFLLGYYAVGPNVTRAQLVSPSMRATWAEEVSAIDVAAIPNSPYNWAFLSDAAIPLNPDEALNALAAEDNAAAARATILVWLCDQPPQPLIGMEIRTVRVTGTTTLIANAWTNGTLTFADTLPSGRYALVGARMRSTNLQAFRFNFKGGMYRPGAIGCQVPSDLEDPIFRRGRLGVWGEFQHNTPPSVDFLANAADTAQTGELDLVYLR